MADFKKTTFYFRFAYPNPGTGTGHVGRQVGRSPTAVRYGLAGKTNLGSQF